jgi:hypothetical protein
MNTNTPPPYLITDNCITLSWNGESYTVPGTAVNYPDLKRCLLDGEYDSISDHLNPGTSLASISEGRITIRDNNICYDNEIVNNAAAQKLLNLLDEGLADPRPWMRFIEKLMQNPSYNSRKQLYKFLEHSNMPINEEGDVIGYKGVNNDYTDIYSGKFDNSVGCVNAMERTNVDDSVDHGCSAGFHIGSHEYADSWGSNGRLMQVSFNPKDAVSVPHCSEYQKLRVCRYKVIGECHAREKLDDGLYSGDQDRSDKINKYIHKKLKKGKDILFRKMAKKFRNLTAGEIHQATDNIYIDWSNDHNDYIITPYLG